MLNLTTYAYVDVQYLREISPIKEDTEGKSIYKYFCKLTYGDIMWKPHKFSSVTNGSIPYTKVDINPKYFDNLKTFQETLYGLFSESEDIYPGRFNVSRIDLKSDIEDLSIDVVLPRLYVMGYRRDSVSIIKNSTIYIGSNPKIRIYDKIKEIKYRLKKGWDISEENKEMLLSGKEFTRFEIQIRGFKGTLKYIIDDPVGLVSYFDRIQFYNFEDDEKIASMGGLQLLMSKIPRKKRIEFEKFRDKDLESHIRNNYITSVKDWVDGKNDRLADVPF
jgi:hypothetical protein